MNRVATITYIQNKILLPIRYEVSAKPHTVREVRDSNSNDSHLLEWDANGNLQYYYFRSPEMERWHCWDEDNRLQATSDNHYTAFYQYGADGNRVRMREQNGRLTLTVSAVSSISQALDTLAAMQA